MEEKKMSAPMVEDRNALCDDGNHQDDYSMDDACVKLLSAVLMHNRIPARVNEYDFDYDAGAMSEDMKSYGPEVKLIRSFHWSYLARSGEKFSDGYELLHLRDAEAVMEAVRYVTRDTEVYA